MNGISVRVVASMLAAILFCACATTSQKHSYRDTTPLVLGKTTAAECRAFYGEPKERDERNGGDGNTETFRYVEVLSGVSKGYARLLLLEFKEGVLNGYATGSSYPDDRTRFALTNLAKVQFAVSTKDDVRSLLGAPHGMMRCPTGLIGGLSKCKAAGREIWVYTDFRPVPLTHPRPTHLFTGTTCVIVFDNKNRVIDLSSSQSSAF